MLPSISICQLCDIPLCPFICCDPPIIHRDIKPSNILLTPSDHVILIDFDASREFDAGKPEDTVLLGTREYAAPEQYGFGQSDARSDIYALGVLLNKMLTGTYPRRECPECSLGEIITRCTALLSDQRYASVEELKTALTSRSSKSAPPRPAASLIQSWHYCCPSEPLWLEAPSPFPRRLPHST